jgi:hypothetical protein
MDTAPSPKREGISSSAETSRKLRVLRSTIVTMGPSLILVLWMVAGTLATIAFAFSSGTNGASQAWRTLAAAGTACLCLVLGSRQWYLRWGTPDAVLAQTLPGDDLLARPVVDITRAVTIQADASSVWEWLVQIGQGRGGLFSYDWLENLAGLDIHTIDRIVPELQHLSVGDPIPLAPGENNGLLVAAIEPGRALVLRLCDPKEGGCVDPSRPGYFDVSWAFILSAAGKQATRLISRFRISGRPRLSVQLLYSFLIEIPHFVMERKMLLGIKRRAEKARIP